MLLKFMKNAFSKERVLIKAIPDLTPLEQEQLAIIVKRYYPTAGDTYVHERTKIDCGFDLTLLKDAQRILGVSYYSLHHLPTPFTRHATPVIHFGQAMKQEAYQGNIIWRLGTIYSLRKMGILFPFKKVMGVSTIVSPRVYEKFKQLFPMTFDRLGQPHGRAVHGFLNYYLQKARQLSMDVDHDFCYTYPHVGEDDITDDWERFYRAKDEAINALFFERGILVRRNGRIYKSGKHLVACGYRKGWNKRQPVELLNDFSGTALNVVGETVPLRAVGVE